MRPMDRGSKHSKTLCINISFNLNVMVSIVIMLYLLIRRQNLAGIYPPRHDHHYDHHQDKEGEAIYKQKLRCLFQLLILGEELAEAGQRRRVENVQDEDVEDDNCDEEDF